MITIISTGWYDCSRHKEHGNSVCTNSMYVRRSLAEARLLETLKDSLLSDTAAQKFASRVRERTAERARTIGPARERLRKAERELENIMTAIKVGVITPTIKEELLKAERRKRSKRRRNRCRQSIPTRF